MNTLYREMIQYVKEELQKYDGDDTTKKSAIHYNRFAHTMRVCRWVQTLYNAYPHREQIDYEALFIAAIFHDIGYCNIDNIQNHAETGAAYCRDYLMRKQFPTEKIDFICDLIAKHSDKKSMSDIPMELVLLREADLLDDTGAHGLVLDIWMETVCNETVSFESILEHMEKYTVRLMKENPMRTEKARRIWEQKRQLTEDFVSAYRTDLQMPEIE